MRAAAIAAGTVAAYSVESVIAAKLMSHFVRDIIDIKGITDWIATARLFHALSGQCDTLPRGRRRHRSQS